jgi:crotonobetainyl-CoA:carnitine CoA-transferase CaiB-like acyl-CoA transferase
VSGGALSGVLAVELGSTIAGPFCGRLLADFGATVIKVEDPRGDTVRNLGEHVAGHSLYAASLLRNKSAVALDLRTDAGREAAMRLIARSDVVIENFRPGAMEAWGLDYGTLSASNPGLVMVRISGFGQTGPYSRRPGYGVIDEAVSGLRSVTGDADRPPTRVGMALTDYVTGLYAAFGALVALEERRRSGCGQVVDAALSECAFSLMESFVPAYAHSGTVPVRAGSRLPGSPPNNLYTAADGTHVHVTAFADPVFRRLCAAMGRAELASDPRYATGLARSRHEHEVDTLVAEWVGTRDGEAVERALADADVPASRVFDVADIFRDAHFHARGMLAKSFDPHIGEVTLAAPVPLMSRTPARIRFPGRPIGADTAQVLEEVAGLTGHEIAILAEAGAFGDAYRRPALPI